MPSDAHDAIASMLRQAPLLGVIDEERDVAQLRREMEAMTAGTAPPEGTVTEPVEVAGIRAEWSSGPGADANRVLLYLHGGAYIVGSIATHRALVARIARAAGIRALSLEYRLAPEHPFPAALEDACAAYRFLLESGFAPAQIAIGGDSAGGGLALGTLIALRESGLPLPGAAIVLSPWTDLAVTGDSVDTRGEADPMIGDRDTMREGAAMYLGGADPRTPAASPLYADLRGLPPIAIQVGTAERLLDDSLRFTARIREAGGEVDLETFEDLIHVFQAFAPYVPESVEAIERLGKFLAARL